ncbi:MAG: lysophospholipid transporter LplT [Betaproteobacteria bacterium]|nr:lysophospholipid transporter LplT [Betaproteobacteria bacterium]
MKRGFYTIMAAQFFSSLADNALFVAAVELLKASGGAEWQRAALVPMFALFYVVLAPFVGAFADSRPKGQVMFVSNGIKVVGCLMMLFGSHPLISYAIVGLGAAAYSPAKYGILTELLPPSMLVKANGWIEGLTIGSIILGVLIGGQLVGPMVSGLLLSVDVPFIDTGIDTPPEAAISLIVFLYVLAAWFNTRIPETGVTLVPLHSQKEHGLVFNLLALVPDFWRCNKLLWTDKLGQISLATTTLFWGASGNLRYIVLAWSAVALGYSTTQASSLVGVGIAMGLLILVMNFISNVWIAAPFFVLLGGLGGFLVVPMNALLQHRGHNLMGAGRSIAVQNFNEQACILALGGLYALATGMGLSAFAAIVCFGLFVAGNMWLIQRWHASNCLHHAQEVARLMEIARQDPGH